MAAKKIAVGRYARLATAARVDCIGRVVRHTSVGLVIRVENWCADGYPREFYGWTVDFERSTAAAARAAAEKRRSG